MAHKAGFVSIIGRPNVGKSTLMNALIGEKLSITNPKAQTTRHRIMGIWNDEDHQIVFSDTPGMLDPAYKLQETMMNAVEGAMKDADLLLYLVEPDEPLNDHFVEWVNRLKVPVLLIVNKIDQHGQDAIGKRLKEWAMRLPDAECLPVSALHKFNLDGLLAAICDRLKEHPPYYGKDELTDRPVRFFISEIIREKILKYFKKEIPYSVEVSVEDYTEGDEMDRIKAIIYTERESQKRILIGGKGRAIKRMGTDARRDIEHFIRKRAFLDLTVKVRKDWRTNDLDLEHFGYQ